MRITICLLLIIGWAAPALAQNATVATGRQLYEAKKPAEAKKILTQIDDDHKDYAAAQYYLGRIAYDEKQYEDAADFLAEAAEANPNVADYHFWHGAAMGMDAQQSGMMRKGMLAPKIKTAFEKTVALDPKNIEAMNSLVQFYIQAPGFMGGDLKKGLEMANRMKALDKARGAMAAAEVHLADKKPALAEAEYAALVKAEPTKMEYLIALANYYLGQKQYDKAFAVYDPLLKKEPENLSASYQLGKLAAVSGLQLDRGETGLKKYLQTTPAKDQPQPANAYHRLGMIYEHKKNLPEARKCFEQAVKLDPSLKDAKERLAKLKG
jgi:tetratricopeptide (TPR) repeat protein